MRFALKPFLIFSISASAFLCTSISAADEYKPIRIGGFFLSPKLQIEQRYSDNIHASTDDRDGDFATAVKPSIIIKKLYRDHEFSLSGGAETVRYYNHSEENMFNYQGEVAGRLTARRVLTLPFKLSYAVDHKDRSHDRGARTREPIRLNAMRSEIGAEYDPGRLMLGVYGGYNQIRYENEKMEGGTEVIREDGDYNSLYFRVKALYRTRMNIMPFVSIQVNENNYLRRSYDGAGFNGLRRDNRVLRGLGGIEFKYHNILSGSAAFGREWRRYKERSIDDIQAFSAEGQIEWTPFRKTKLSLEFMRHSEEDDTVDDGIVETLAAVGADYELKHDFFLNGDIEWENTKFQNTDRSDNVYGGSVGLSYMLNSKLDVGASYLRRQRDSTQSSARFDENVFMLRLTGKL